MITITVDCAALCSRADLHGTIREQLAQTTEKYGIEYIGNNLDALHDVITSIGDEMCFVLISPEAAREKLGTYIDALREMLADCNIGTEIK